VECSNGCFSLLESLCLVFSVAKGRVGKRSEINRLAVGAVILLWFFRVPVVDYVEVLLMLSSQGATTANFLLLLDQETLFDKVDFLNQQLHTTCVSV